MTSLSTRFLGQPKLTNPTFNYGDPRRSTTALQDSMDATASLPAVVDGVLLIGLREVQIDGTLQVSLGHLRRAFFVFADGDDNVAEVHGIAGTQLRTAVGE